LDETTLIPKLKAGDHQAFRMLVEAYQEQVLNTCYGFVHNKEEAEDLTQEVFVEVFRSIEKFRGDAKQKMLEKIPENQRIAFTLHKYEGLSYKEVAEIMGLSLPAIESLMHRGKTNLKKKLSVYYKNKMI